MKKIFTFLLLAFLMIPIGAQAHLAAGEDKVVGEYLIDFGYDPQEITAGEQTSLLFNLVDNASQTAIGFSDVWTRISSEKGVIYTATLHGEGEGKASTLIFTFPEAGDYEIRTEFHNKTENLVSTGFHVDVHGDSETGSLLAKALAILILILVGAIVFRKV